MNTVTHIVPMLSPVVDGVGDYALNLARTLRDVGGLESRFVVCNSSWKGPAEIEGFPVTGPTHFKTNALVHALGTAQTVILHYVGYGFHRKGVPSWLVRAIEQWRRGNPRARLVTIFHEIWSAGPPWRTVFFLGPIQRQLVAQLLNLSAHAFISTRWSLELLEAIQPGRTTLLPVSANIQPCSEEPARGRVEGPWRPLIFGQAWTRIPAIERHARLLDYLNRTGKLDRVLLMGKEVGSDLAGEEVEALRKVIPDNKLIIVGEKPAAEAADQFRSADFFLSSHNARDICKSSALMSAFSCECPAVVANRKDPAPLEEDVHFMCCSGSELDIEEFERKILAGILPRIARNAQAWFRENAAWPVIALQIAAHLQTFPGR